jgi:type II secretion system protein J
MSNTPLNIEYGRQLTQQNSSMLRWRRSGFTLLEVIVAMTISVSAFAILWGAIRTSNLLQETVTQRYDRVRNVQSSLLRMQREISMAFVTKIGEQPSNDRGEQTYLTAFIGESEELQFTNFAHHQIRSNEAASTQSEIGYFITKQRGTDGRLHENLVRREQAPIDGEPEEGGYVYTLLKDIESIEFEYWRPDREIAGNSWERSWDTTDTGVTSLPTRVRITIEIEDPLNSSETLVFSTISEIHLILPVGFVSQTLAVSEFELPDESALNGETLGIEGTAGSGRQRPTPSTVQTQRSMTGQGTNR